jgi:TRAF3-interacting protein 1
MAEQLEPWIEETQKKLGAVIQTPKLTDKLLRKPPFRFLHDIVTAFMKTTGLLGGLFNDAELNPGKEAEKDVKLSFLNKIIAVCGAAHDANCPAKSVKIIAGAEPEATNAMLVMLAGLKELPKAKVDNGVQVALGNDAAPAKAASTSPPPAQEKPRETTKPAAAAAAAPAPEIPPAPMERPQSQGGGRSRPGAAPAAAPPAQAAPPSVPQVTALPSQDAAARPGTASARKPPPAVRSNEVVESGPHESVSKAPVATVIQEAKGGAGAADDEDDGAKASQERDWVKLVEEEQARAASGGAGGAAGGGDGNNAARGYLANQAAQAKREQEEAKKKAEDEAAAAGRSSTGVVLKTKKKDDKGAGSIGTTEMSKLREQLQLLTKASTPLGKFLEALHEDVDTMARELEMWKTEARTQSLAAADARRQTDEALRELHAKQQALEDAVNDKQAQINIVRGTIIRNDSTIDTLIRMVVNPEGTK